jgi:FkbM family methyltransferase
MKKIIKKILSSFNLDIIKSTSIEYIKHANHTPFHALIPLISLLTIDQEKLKIIQIGANDGQKDDLFSKITKKIHAEIIFIEPQKIPFEKIKSYYKNHIDFHFENIAIADKNGDTDFFYFKEEFEGPINLSLFSSFDYNNILKYKNLLNINSAILNEKIKSETISSLIQRYEWSSSDIDVIIMDCEGYDPVILKNLFNENIYPKVIQFESRNISDSEINEIVNLLKENKYYHIFDFGDIVAIKYDVESLNFALRETNSDN